MTADAARQALVDAVGAGPDGLGNFLARGDVLAGAQLSRFDFADDMANGVVADS